MGSILFFGNDFEKLKKYIENNQTNNLKIFISNSKNEKNIVKYHFYDINNKLVYRNNINALYIFSKYDILLELYENLYLTVKKNSNKQNFHNIKEMIRFYFVELIKCFNESIDYNMDINYKEVNQLFLYILEHFKNILESYDVFLKRDFSKLNLTFEVNPIISRYKKIQQKYYYENPDKYTELIYELKKFVYYIFEKLEHKTVDLALLNNGIYLFSNDSFFANFALIYSFYGINKNLDIYYYYLEKFNEKWVYHITKNITIKNINNKIKQNKNFYICIGNRTDKNYLYNFLKNKYKMIELEAFKTNILKI